MYNRKLPFKIIIIACLIVSQLYVSTTYVLAQENINNNDAYTEDKIPGDPANEVRVLTNLYQLIQIYRQRHEGEYPNDKAESSLFDDVVKNFSAYKLEGYSAFTESLINPDNRYASDSTIRKHPQNVLSCTFPSLRHDSKKLGAAKHTGTQDLLSYSGLYYHANSPTAKDTRAANPVGYYMTLWDNGNIEKIPYDQTLFVPRNDKYTIAFFSQAGLPWNCLTYGEFMKDILLHKIATHDIPIGFPFSPGQMEPKPDNGGIESLVWMTRLFGLNIMREPIWDSLGHQVKDFTLKEVADGASKIDFPLQQKVLSLDELQRLQTPAILFLSDVGRIVTMSAIDDNYAIIYDRGMTLNIPRAELEKRYSGNALIANSANEPSGITVMDQISPLSFASTKDEIDQVVSVTNDSDKPVSVVIERPLCGIIQAKLSKDKIASGKSVTLELTFGWRDVLPGNKQSTFITIKTDNPARPRLQLGFDLMLSE